jgi:hypothetical protein
MSLCIPYKPKNFLRPPRQLQVPTAWNGVQDILADVIDTFKIHPGRCLEFGVDWGFSTACLANFFNEVTAVDTFAGDVHAGCRPDDQYEQVLDSLKGFVNIKLVRADFRDFIKSPNNDQQWNFCHIDIVHTYRETKQCLDWAIDHADVVACHDSIAFGDVRRAVQDICWESGRRFYEYQEGHGFAILVK